MLDWSTCTSVERDSSRVSGEWVFVGTRVPVSALFENLEDGAKPALFLEWLPGVTGQQVRAVLDHAARSLGASRVAGVRVLFDQGGAQDRTRVLQQRA